MLVRSSAAWNISEVQLMDGEPTSDIQCINANGCLACINSNYSSNSSMVSNAKTANAQMVQTMATQSTTSSGGATNIEMGMKVSATFQTVAQSGGVIPGWIDNGSNMMETPQYKLTATYTKASSADNITISGTQDLSAIIKITYSDGSYSYCQTSGFLPDDNGKTGSQTTNGATITYTDTDFPSETITSSQRQCISQVYYSGTAKEYVCVQNGSNAPQVAQVVTWNFDLTANFDKPMGNLNPLYRADLSSYKTTPVIGGTVNGKLPTATDSPVQPRTPTFNDYMKNTKWTHKNPNGVKNPLCDNFQ